MLLLLMRLSLLILHMSSLRQLLNVYLLLWMPHHVPTFSIPAVLPLEKVLVSSMCGRRRHRQVCIGVDGQVCHGVYRVPSRVQRRLRLRHQALCLGLGRHNCDFWVVVEGFGACGACAAGLQAWVLEQEHARCAHYGLVHEFVRGA